MILNWRRKLLTAVGGCALAIGVTSLVCVHLADDRSRKHHELESLNYLAGPLLRRIERDPARARAAFECWAEMVTGQSGIVRAALLDAEGHPILAHPAQPFDETEAGGLTVPPGFVLRRHELSCVIDGRRASSLALLGLADSDLAGGSGGGVLWPIALVTVAAAAGAIWWVGYRFESPVSSYLKRISSAVGPSDGLDDGGDPADVCTRLISRIEAQQRKVDKWHDECRRLQRIAETKVQAETRHLSSMLQRVEKKARKDSLTGLDNRHCLEAVLPELFEARARAGKDLAIVMVDLDRFKNLNDTLGHPAGDELLQFTGQLLLSHTRPQDLAVRYGGDEFMLVLTEMPCREAAAVARRIAQLFSQHSATLRVQPRPTMSAGVASLKHHAPANIQELINYADAALYHQKRAGRDGVYVLEPETTTV